MPGIGSVSAQDRRRLVYILDAIDLIEERTRSGREAFLADLGEQDAVLWRLYTLADAASQLSEQLQLRYLEIPWQQIRGFRNVAAHGYLDLVAELAWEIVEDHLPALRAAIEHELSG